MQRRFVPALVALACSGGLLLGCSTTYTKEDLKKELTEGDLKMSSEHATCIADGLEAKGVPLNKFKDPTEAETATMTEVTTDCILKDSPLDPSPSK